MKDSISIENHGVTLGISKGINTGVTITSNGKMMNAQLEAHQCAEIAEFLNIYPKEIKRLKRIINSQADRNEELRTGLKESVEHSSRLVEVCEKILESFDKAEDLDTNLFLELRFAFTQVKYNNQKIKKEVE
jgi:uncharacterized membrane protein YccC